MNLDGKDVIVPTPFDAHEKVVRAPHTHSQAEGYKAAEAPQPKPAAAPAPKPTPAPAPAPKPAAEPKEE